MFGATASLCLGLINNNINIEVKFRMSWKIIQKNFCNLAELIFDLVASIWIDMLKLFGKVLFHPK